MYQWLAQHTYTKTKTKSTVQLVILQCCQCQELDQIKKIEKLKPAYWNLIWP